MWEKWQKPDMARSLRTLQTVWMPRSGLYKSIFFILSPVLCIQNAEMCELPQWIDLYTVCSSSVWPLNDSRRQSRGQEEKEVLAFIHQSYFPTESPLGRCLPLQKVPTPTGQPSPYRYSFWIPVTDPNSSTAGLVKSLYCFQF